MTDLCEKKDQLCPLNSRTKCDGDKHILSVEKIVLGRKNRIQSDLKMSNRGVICVEVPYHLQIWECTPLVIVKMK